jgi:uncharacterized membrane protein
MEKITVLCFLASYLSAFGLECVCLVRPSQWFRLGAIVASVAGLTAHTLYLLNQSRQAGLPPLLSSSHDWFLVLAWLAIVVYLFLSLVDRDLALGLFLLPLVLVLIASSYFVSKVASPVVNLASDEMQRSAIRGWGMLHATLLVFGIGCVLVGLVLSVMYLVQHRRLKHKHAMQNGMTLPSLERLARMTWWAIGTAVPLLLFGMLTGIGLWYARLREDAATSLLDPVVIGNGVVWLGMMALFAWLRFTRRSAAKQVAWLTVWAFGLLLATLVGLEVLSPGHFSSSKQATVNDEQSNAKFAIEVCDTDRRASRSDSSEFVPEGTFANSPAFLTLGLAVDTLAHRPGGTKGRFCRPFRGSVNRVMPRYPALKRWAILCRPMRDERMTSMTPIRIRPHDFQIRLSGDAQPLVPLDGGSEHS